MDLLPEHKTRDHKTPGGGGGGGGGGRGRVVKRKDIGDKLLDIGFGNLCVCAQQKDK